jgi:hypothetical protein
VDAQIAQPVLRRKWYEIWLDVWMHPGTEAFQSILNDEDHNALRGYIWTGVTSLLVTLLGSITTLQYMKALPTGIPYGLQEVACVVILAPLSAIFSLIISSGFYHLVAKFLGGKGTWGNLAICLSAVLAPSTLIFAVLGGVQSILSQTPPLSFIIVPISLVVGIYVLVLNFNGIRAVEGLDAGRAVLTVFTPWFFAIALVACITLALLPNVIH